LSAAITIVGHDEDNRIIKTTGEVVPLPPPANGTDYQLSELRSFVGAQYIELVRIDDRNFMVVDEDYLAKRPPFNRIATEMYNEMLFLNGYLDESHIVLGDVAIIDSTQVF